MKRIAGKFGLAFLVTGLMIVLIETVGFWKYTHPRNAIECNASRTHYFFHHRKNLVFSPEYGRHDAEFSYSFLPGEHCCRNSEYHFDFNVNQYGFRTQDEEWDRPEILVLGDSHTTGWGVQEHELYSRRLATSLDRKVGHIAMPSFAAAREFKALKQFVNCSNATYLVIQYCDNDALENASFRDRGNRVVAMREKDWLRASATDAKNQIKFLPYTRSYLPLLADRYRDVQPSAIPDILYMNRNHKRDAESFINVLTHSAFSYGELHLVFLEISGFNLIAPEFLSELDHQLHQMQIEEGLPFKSWSMLDISKQLTSDHYFRFDDHMNASGHEAVGAALKEHILELENSEKL